MVEENNLQVQVSALRKILGPETIATIPGRGYRFTVALTSAESQTFRLHRKCFRRSMTARHRSPFCPLSNLSDDVANEYFADGLAEELLNVLSKIRGLKVVSRTSSFYFKGRNVDLASIAQKLNVAAVVQGSVRKSGTRVRITAQLIQVATDSHLWSETYDRELDDIFAVQDDIAQSVVKELRAALLGDGRRIDGERHCCGGGAGRSDRPHRQSGGLSPLSQGAQLPRGQPAGDGQECRLLPAGRGPGTRLCDGLRRSRRGLHQAGLPPRERSHRGGGKGTGRGDPSARTRS